MHEVKRVVKQADRVSKLEKCRERALLIVEVVNKGGSWARLWDSICTASGYTAYRWDQGPLKDAGTSHHIHGSKRCPLCDENNLDANSIGHLLRVHQHEIGLDRTPVDSVDQLVTQIAQAHRQGGFEGFARTPFWPPKDFIYTALTVQFKCPTIH